MQPVRIVSLCLGFVGLVFAGIAFLAIGFGTLGFLGVLADVSYAENRQMGIQLLAYGMPPLVGGAVLLVAGAVGFFAFRGN